MKQFLFRFSLLIVPFILALDVHARMVTVVLNSIEQDGPVKLSHVLTVSSNEVVTMRAVKTIEPDLADVAVIAGGVEFQRSKLGEFITPIVGPAELHFSMPPGVGFNGYSQAYITLEIQTMSFPPDKTAVLPAGSAGTVSVESSTDLVEWQGDWAHSIEPTNDNRFFRLRAETATE